MRKQLKEPYEYAEIETITFSDTDVIATSGETPPQGNPDGWTGEW